MAKGEKPSKLNSPASPEMNEASRIESCVRAFEGDSVSVDSFWTLRLKVTVPVVLVPINRCPGGTTLL